MDQVVNRGNEYNQEVAKWEQFPTLQTLHPGNPYKFREFPKMLYRAQRIPAGLPGTGKVAVALSEPERYAYQDEDKWRLALEGTNRFNEACYVVVNDDKEEARYLESGWRKSQADAMEFYEGRERGLSKAAAERAYADRNMSEAAQSEARRHDEDTFEHQPEIPEQPKKRRGRPPKAKPAVA